MLQTIHLHLPAPLPFQSLNVHPETLVSDLPLPPTLLSNNTYLRTSTHILSPHTPISSLRHADSPNHPISINVCARLPGGKGGFGSQLRAAGGRMSTGKATNMDSCRDLSGRRLGTIKEAQRQADLLESAPALRAKLAAEEKSKLEALERKLGISTPDSFDDDAQGEGSSKRKVEDVNLEELAAKKYKFEDNKFLEESREINEGVRNAVSKAMLLKKKKKPTTTTLTADTKGKGKEKVEEITKKEKEKISMPPPALTNVA
uniref:SDE2-like domain-containing protein n=1 Tax=Kwoniella bestiolae CBS 10118 TaxID=1296100 RepID=A0A1B9G6X3_9TREE|nr:hypothetical protein I302_04429 [Kwoniella bestiolae CBS 10118]OCF26741.1 hypothetical protein I302_04429 [Kwoniella bestiolae CBS 10118]